MGTAVRRGARRNRVAAARQRGFAYLVLLFWVAIAGATMATLAHSWSLDARREREAELEFRGKEYARALGSYAAARGAYPAELADLLEDRKGKDGLRRHIRRLYPDPVTRSPNWGLTRNDKGGITAIYSDSPLPLVRKHGDAATYRDWVFEAQAPAPASGASDAAATPPADAASSDNSPFKPLFPTTPANPTGSAGTAGK